VTGYNFYYGTASHTYTNEISLGDATTVTLTNLVAGVTYYFAVTDYEKDGAESGFSNEAVYTIPLSASNQPALLTSVNNSNGQFSFTLSGAAGNSYVIEASTDLVNWSPVFTNVAPFTFTIPINSQYSQQFFRAYGATNTAAPNSTVSPATTPAVLTSAAQINGQFSFTVSGVPGSQYIVEASTNLVDWSEVATNLSPFTFTATNTAQFNQQFFRAVYLPP
jgi:hypothetical protein